MENKKYIEECAREKWKRKKGIKCVCVRESEKVRGGRERERSIWAG